MSIESYGSKDVVTVSPDQTLADGAALLAEHGVGCVVAAEGGAPVGVLTDRDLTLRVLAEGADPATERVAAAMEAPAVTIEGSASMRQAIQLMRDRGVRRLPIVDAGGRLTGLVSADDFVPLLATELLAVRSAVAGQTAAPAGSTPRTRSVEEHFQKPVVTISEAATAAEAARLMADKLVGCIVVTGDGDHPVGIVTDRDLALKTLFQPERPLREIMSQPLKVVAPDVPLEHVAQLMGQNGVRRVPVVRQEHVIGLISLDDVLVLLGRELADLGVAFQHAIARSQRERRLRNLRAELHATVDWSLERAEELGEKAQENLVHVIKSFQSDLRKRLA